jgi:hypothetical protein
MIAAMSTHNGHRYCLVHDIHRFTLVVSCRFHLSAVIQLPHIRYHITHGFVLLCLEGVGKHVAHKAANQPTMRKHASIRFELATTSTATQSDAKRAALLNVLQRVSCAWLSLHLAERAAKEICNVRCVFVCLVCYILFVVLGVMWFCFEWFVTFVFLVEFVCSVLDKASNLISTSLFIFNICLFYLFDVLLVLQCT